MDAGWQRVAVRVDSERARRGYSLAAFARATGLGKSTIDHIVHNRKTSYDPSTLAAVERALGWRSGSIDRIKRGLEPQHDGDPDLQAILDAWPQLSPGSRRMLRMLATEAARVE